MKCRIIDNKYNERYGRCLNCGDTHWYNIKLFRVDAYNIKYKMVKDHQREKYHKELLQPIDKHGRRNEEFYKTYGDPKDQKNPNSQQQ